MHNRAADTLGNEPPPAERDVTVRTVARVARLLKQLASAGEFGVRITDLANDLGLSKPTVHRLVGALAQAGLASHDTSTRRYRLGAVAAMLGQASTRITVANESRQSLVRLAKATEDTVFVSVQEGSAAICVGREIGNFPIRTLTLEVGDQRPLGVGAGSMALFAFLPGAEIDALMSRNATWLTQYPQFTPKLLRQHVLETRARGYSVNRDRVVPGMSALGVPAFGPDGRPVASFSVACGTERIAGSREAELVAALRAEAALLSAMFCAGGIAQPLNGAR
jgi:DNA-binding IclR family transcriptional regulator